MKRQLTIEVVVFLLVVMFLYASISKYIDHGAFVRAMEKQPFPDWLNGPLVTFIPPLEILICLMLIFPGSREYGLLAAMALMLVFTLYIAAVLLHVFPKVPCSCGGIINRFGWGEHLVFNVFFLIIAASGLYLEKKGKLKVIKAESA